MRISPWLRGLRVVVTVYNERRAVPFDYDEFVRYARTFLSENNRQSRELFHASVKGEPIKRCRDGASV